MSSLRPMGFFFFWSSWPGRSLRLNQSLSIGPSAFIVIAFHSIHWLTNHCHFFINILVISQSGIGQLSLAFHRISSHNHRLSGRRWAYYYMFAPSFFRHRLSFYCLKTSYEIKRRLHYYFIITIITTRFEHRKRYCYRRDDTIAAFVDICSYSIAKSTWYFLYHRYRLIIYLHCYRHTTAGFNIGWVKNNGWPAWLNA